MSNYTAEQLQSMYCEDYDGQEGQGFTVLSCEVPGKDLFIEDIADNLAAQVLELRRKFGQRANICVYK